MPPTYEKRFIPRIVTSAGSLSAPAIVCPTDADTGLFWNGTNFQFCVDGSLRAFWSGNGINSIRYGGTPARMYGFHANGTESSPTATADTETLFDFLAHGHNGTGFAPGATMRFRQDGAVSGANVPCEVIMVSRNSSGGGGGRGPRPRVWRVSDSRRAWTPRQHAGLLQHHAHHEADNHREPGRKRRAGRPANETGGPWPADGFNNRIGRR